MRRRNRGLLWVRHFSAKLPGRSFHATRREIRRFFGGTRAETASEDSGAAECAAGRVNCCSDRAGAQRSASSSPSGVLRSACSRTRELRQRGRSAAGLPYFAADVEVRLVREGSAVLRARRQSAVHTRRAVCGLRRRNDFMSPLQEAGASRRSTAAYLRTNNVVLSASTIAPGLLFHFAV